MSDQQLMPTKDGRSSAPIMSQRAHDYPFSQYNLFVECYNMECNKVDDTSLKLMHESEVYRFIFQMLVKPMGKVILAFSLTFLPILNLIFYALIWNSLTQYNRAKKVFKSNLQLVSNPFQNMVFSPEVCEMMGKNHWFFSIEEKDIYGFSFDSLVIKRLKARVGQGQIKFMVYDDTFQNYYLLFPKFYRMHLTWVILSTIMLLIFSTLLVLFIFYQISQQQDKNS